MPKSDEKRWSGAKRSYVALCYLCKIVTAAELLEMYGMSQEEVDELSARYRAGLIHVTKRSVSIPDGARTRRARRRQAVQLELFAKADKETETV